MHIVMSRTGVVVVVVVLAMVTMMACSVHGNELDDMLYDDLASKPCVRLMTATGSVGCASTSLCCRGVCFCVCVCVRVCLCLCRLVQFLTPCSAPYGGKRTSGLLFLVDSTTRAQCVTCPCRTAHVDSAHACDHRGYHAGNSVTSVTTTIAQCC